MKNKLLCTWALLVVLTQLLVGCRKEQAPSKFVSNHGKTYFEVTDNTGLHRVYTHETADMKVMMVLDQDGVPDAIAVIDSARARAMVTEYRGKQDVSPPGLQLLTREYMDGIPSSSPAFEEWKRKFSLFRVSRDGTNKTFKFAKTVISPISIKVEGSTIIFPVAQMRCENDDPDSSTICNVDPMCRCIHPHVCRAIDCALRHDSECVARELKAALDCGASVSPQEGGGGQPKPQDLIVPESNGGFRLAY